jgi:hypothetical protein
LVRIEIFEPFGSEGRPSTVAQQPFDPAPVIRFDAHGFTAYPPPHWT